MANFDPPVLAAFAFLCLSGLASNFAAFYYTVKVLGKVQVPILPITVLLIYNILCNFVTNLFLQICEKLILRTLYNYLQVSFKKLAKMFSNNLSFK
jgi:hypothetical protein